MNNFFPACYLELSISLAEKWKFPVLIIIAISFHGSLFLYCEAQQKCIELIAKDLTFIIFTLAIIMKGSVIIDTLLRSSPVIHYCRKMEFWKSNRVNSEPSVRYKAENNEANHTIELSCGEEHSGRPQSSQSGPYHGQKHHLVSFRTGLLFILSIVIVGLCINVYYTKIDQNFHSSEFYYFLYVIVIPIYSTVAVYVNDNLRNYSKFVIVKILNTLF